MAFSTPELRQGLSPLARGMDMGLLLPNGCCKVYCGGIKVTGESLVSAAGVSVRKAPDQEKDRWMPAIVPCKGLWLYPNLL